MLKKIGSKLSVWFSKAGLAGKVSIALLTLGASILPLSSSIADSGIGTSSNNSPRFNFLQGDVEMMRLSRQSQPAWTDPISASNGEQVAFLLYFHNGVLDTTAHNTKLRVDLPNEAGTELKMTSYLWSDETPYITDTVVNGQIVGQSGGTVNLNSAARIRYVPGSTRIYQNGSQTGEALPDGITTSAGINIGNIQGCWQYSGYVTFLAELFGNSTLTLDKKVANIGGSFVQQINAKPGEEIAYRIAVRNDGDITAATALVKDELATYTSYIPGSAYLSNSVSGANSVKLSDTLTTTGVTLTNIAPGSDATQYITFHAKVDTSIPAGTWGLVNVAKVYIGDSLQDRAEAKVIVVSTVSISLDKRVYDPTNRTWEKISNSMFGEVRTFKITIKNTGNQTINNVVVKDVLPLYSTLYSAVTLNGATLSSSQQSQFFSNGLSIGSLAANQQSELVFQVVSSGCPQLGESLITNTAYSSASGVSEVTSSAQIRITVLTPTAPVN